MNCGIDTFACNGGRSGIGVYLYQLLKHFPRDQGSLELFGWEFDRYAYSEAAEDLEYQAQGARSGTLANSLWHIFRYPDFVKNRGYDVTFFPAADRRLPRRSPCPSIGTVHDMAAYRGPRRSRAHLGALLRMVLPDSLRHLSQVIAVSNWVKQEILDVAGVPESRITVIPDGIDLEEFHPRARGEESVVLIQPFSFRRPYILYAARLDHPVKNHVRLIDAFGIFKERTRHPHRLVLAGVDSRASDHIKKHAAASKWGRDIFFTGHFPRQSLPELYAGADFVVIPSLYEGFGLGALESMASGVPVACARAASLPEVADHAALYFDPYDCEDMADRMVTLTSDRDCYRECISRGLERVKNYSWERCAEATFSLIQEYAGGRE